MVFSFLFEGASIVRTRFGGKVSTNLRGCEEAFASAQTTRVGLMLAMRCENAFNCAPGRTHHGSASTFCRDLIPMPNESEHAIELSMLGSNQHNLS